jgi:polygalacturonase
LVQFIIKLSFYFGCVLLISTVIIPESVKAESIVTIDATVFGANGQDSLDDTKSIQQALDQAYKKNGGLVTVTDGKYLLSSSLKIGSNTHLKLSEETIFFRSKAYTPMIRNNTKGAKRYSGNHDIIIEGGTWEGNSTQYPVRFNHITIGHAENITIQNTNLLNNYGSHHIEFAGVQNGRILNNYIEGYKGEKKKEAIQLDIVRDRWNFPAFGEYDNTPCHKVLIDGNTIVNHSRGIGNHNTVPGVFQTDIKIHNNHFKGIVHEAINALDFNQLYIRNNLFEKVGSDIIYISNLKLENQKNN